MRFSRVLAALLCFTTWMGVVHATHAPVSSCCLGWSNTRVSPKGIVDYTFQTEGVCSIAAVVFQRTSGAKICSDPNTDWAKRVILKVDEEKKLALQEKRQNEEVLTSNATPTVSLPLKNTPQKKGRNGNGRRRQKKKSRGGRRGQKKCV